MATYPAMNDDLETLRRELDALKQQLQQERGSNNSNSLPPNIHHSSASQRAKQAPGDLCLFIDHAAVGSRRGKWLLRERQVLGRTASSDDACATLKVRETWVWSGRTVVLDKIVRLEEVPPQRQTKAANSPKKKVPAEKTGAVEKEAATQPVVTVAVQQSGEADTSKAASKRDPVNIVELEAAAASATNAKDDVREASLSIAEPPLPDSSPAEITVHTQEEL